MKSEKKVVEKSLMLKQNVLQMVTLGKKIKQLRNKMCQQYQY